MTALAWAFCAWPFPVLLFLIVNGWSDAVAELRAQREDES